MQKKKAIMIGAGIANMAAAVYLIQEGKWNGEDITFYSLDNHGSNDGAPTDTVTDEYWNKNHPMENRKGYVELPHVRRSYGFVEPYPFSDGTWNDSGRRYSGFRFETSDI
jgi:flagellar basal body rod protein FlgC